MDGLHGTKKFSRDFYDRDSIYVDEISITRNNGHVRDNGERKRESPALFKEICLGRFRLVNNDSDCSIDRDERARCKDCITIKASTDVQGCTNRANRM